MSRRKDATRAVLYHRVSTIDQNPTAARRSLLAFARARGFHIVDNIEETGSGTKRDRPGYKRVLELARTRQVDVVIVWKSDRFSRSALDFLGALEQLKAWGVRFMSASEGFVDVGPGGDAASELVIGVLAIAAQFERNRIAERTREALANLAANGVRLGRPVMKGAPDGARVRRHRERGESWSQIAATLGCTVDAARRALKRLERGRVEG